MSAIDLVERLRALAEWDEPQDRVFANHELTFGDLDSAADTITRLQAALKPFAKAADIAEQMGVEIGLQVTPPAVPILLDTLRQAREAYRSSVGGE